MIYEYDKDTVAVAKKIDQKDISDMRDEKTKMKALLQEKENEQLAQIKKQQDLMSAYEEKFKSSATEASASAAEDKIEESQSLSVSKGKDRQTESYDTDTFEEQSASQSKSLSMEGSGSKKAHSSAGGK